MFAPVNSALKGVNVETISVDDARAMVKQTVIKATAAPLVRAQRAGERPPPGLCAPLTHPTLFL